MWVVHQLQDIAGVKGDNAGLILGLMQVKFDHFNAFKQKRYGEIIHSAFLHKRVLINCKFLFIIKVYYE